jgi:hypothetical protein
VAIHTPYDSDDWIETDENSPGDKFQDIVMRIIERPGRVIDTEQKAKLRNQVCEFVDVWRVALSRDGPAKVTSFETDFKHDAVPRRSRSRRYAIDYRNWLLKHLKALEEMGFIYRNKSSRWSSPVMIVPKPKHPGDFRVVIYCRYANSQMHHMGGFLPILEISLKYLEGASWFGSLDAFQGFVQFPVQSECQEIYSFVTEYGVCTPSRLIREITESAHAFQAGMMEVFDGMVCITADLDRPRTTLCKDSR